MKLWHIWMMRFHYRMALIWNFHYHYRKFQYHRDILWKDWSIEQQKEHIEFLSRVKEYIS